MSAFVVAAARPVLAIVVVRAAAATVPGQARGCGPYGAVYDGSSDPLAGVTVTVENRPGVSPLISDDELGGALRCLFFGTLASTFPVRRMQPGAAERC
jgi:hypothetical protein